MSGVCKHQQYIGEILKNVKKMAVLNIFWNMECFGKCFKISGTGAVRNWLLEEEIFVFLRNFMSRKALQSV